MERERIAGGSGQGNGGRRGCPGAGRPLPSGDQGASGTTIIKVPGLGCWRAETIPLEGLRPLLGIEE